MRVAMISGASRGVGAAIAERLLAEGWAVSLGLRDPAAAQRFGPEARVFSCHFEATDADTAAAWVAATVQHFGRLDALVNNAAILRPFNLEVGEEAELDQMWAVNVKAPLRLIRAALPHLRRSGAGRVLNLCSTDARRLRQGSPLGYAMSKHALYALTQAVRQEAHADGVRATALCPGAIDTEMIADLPGVTPKADRLQPETVASMVAFILNLPNQANVAEFTANTRLEPTL